MSAQPPEHPPSGEQPSGGSPELIHFEGPWTVDEQRVIERAAAAAEAAGLPHVSPELGRPWVAAKYELAGRTLFMASRLYIEKAFVASSVRALAERIEATDSLDAE